jgi:hypothetical protein
MNLSAIEDRHTEGRAYTPYHPRMMVKVFVYGYCSATHASRRLASKLIDDLATAGRRESGTWL